jgi:hypothetical protein
LNVLHAIRQKRRSGPVLGALVVAWLGIVAAPCAMAWNVSAIGQTDEVLVETHEDCPSAKDDNAMTADECCCEVSAVIKPETSQFAKTIVLVAIPITIPFDFKPRVVAQSFDALGIPLHETSPPVYLTTQRFRI